MFFQVFRGKKKNPKQKENRYCTIFFGVPSSLPNIREKARNHPRATELGLGMEDIGGQWILGEKVSKGSTQKEM